MMGQPSADRPLLRAVNIGKSYTSPRAGAKPLVLFRDLSLEVAAGEMVAIVGESGAGKSSLLHILAALDEPSKGEVWCGATNITRLSQRAAAEFRNREIGYVWQFHYLLPEFTALENVAMPLLARGMRREEALQEAHRWTDNVGLADREDHRSGELSGGEQQRVSIARALVTRPKLLLADEPTGDLDNATAASVFSLLREVQREQGPAGVMVTHNMAFAARCDRMLHLHDGKLQCL